MNTHNSARRHDDGASDEAAGEPLFAARLTPYRSLGPRGFFALMAFIGFTWFIAGMLFVMIGAWPVFGFFGLDFLIVWLAFKANYRAARAFEDVAVWPHQMLVRQVSARGRVTEHRFNPSWTRFEIDRHHEFGITRMALAGHGRDLAIGGFLNPDDRESFARALSAALARVRHG
ncbi:MAG: DUF2244 domain-containing protein [Pseudomonadota bacterium]|nr:DUF2244 domain-containing protein [Pseudomonadota bacterium]